MEQTIKKERRLWPNAPGASGQFYWYKLERQFSKSSWQPNGIEPPWSLDEADKPAIVSFYFFKGGLGRTTTVAAIALLLARVGKRSLIFDLDLESPGVGPLLLENIPLPDSGIVDYLVEWQLLKTRPVNLSSYVTVQNQQDLVDQGQPLRVMTAGRLDAHFLEKLARLDFENFVNQKTNPLVELFCHADDEYDLDFILLDLRSGLHDLGGLSLNGLSHLDILFGLETEQSWAGLEVVLGMLGQLPHREILLVHAMDPRLIFDQMAQTHERFRNHGYDLFKKNYYTVDEDIPDIADDNAPYGLPIAFDTGLINFNRLSSVVPTLTDPNKDYAKLARLIGTFLQRDTI